MLENQTDASPTSSARRARSTCSSSVAGQLFARALERLDEDLSVCVSRLGEPTDLLLRSVLGHERLVFDDLRVTGVIEGGEVCLDQHPVDRGASQLEDRRVVDDRG